MDVEMMSEITNSPRTALMTTSSIGIIRWLLDVKLIGYTIKIPYFPEVEIGSPDKIWTVYLIVITFLLLRYISYARDKIDRAKRSAFVSFLSTRLGEKFIEVWISGRGHKVELSEFEHPLVSESSEKYPAVKNHIYRRPMDKVWSYKIFLCAGSHSNRWRSVR